MPKRQTEEERIVQWFSTAPPEAALAVLNIVKGVIKRRTPTSPLRPLHRRPSQRAMTATSQPDDPNWPPDPAADGPAA